VEGDHRAEAIRHVGDAIRKPVPGTPPRLSDALEAPEDRRQRRRQKRDHEERRQQPAAVRRAAGSPAELIAPMLVSSVSTGGPARAIMDE
jgi:hypothetical protein